MPSETVHFSKDQNRIRVLYTGGEIRETDTVDSILEVTFTFQFEPVSSSEMTGPMGEELLIGFDALLLILNGSGWEKIEELRLPEGITLRKPVVVVLEPFDTLFAMKLLRWGVEDVIPRYECSRVRLRNSVLSAVTRFHRNRGDPMKHNGGLAEIEQKALQTLDNLPFGVLLADRESKILFANRAAKQICSDETGLFLSGDGRCCARDPDENAVLHRLVKDVSKEPDTRDEGNYTLKITGVNGVISTVLAVPVGNQMERHGVALFLDRGEGFFDISAETIKRVYTLTSSEAELLLKLVQGNTLAKIAEFRNVTINTVRAQLKSIFAKTDTQRQASLIKKVLTGPAVLMNQ